jgi:hypothetical protein
LLLVLMSLPAHMLGLQRTQYKKQRNGDDGYP